MFLVLGEFFFLFFELDINNKFGQMSLGRESCAALPLVQQTLSNILTGILGIRPQNSSIVVQ